MFFITFSTLGNKQNNIERKIYYCVNPNVKNYQMVRDFFEEESFSVSCLSWENQLKGPCVEIYSTLAQGFLGNFLFELFMLILASLRADCFQLGSSVSFFQSFR